MNSEDNITPQTTSSSRPFGYWIKAVDRLMAAEFATAFENEGVTRRDWRLLNRVDGSVDTGRPVHPAKLRRLVALGWVDADELTLTDAGRTAKERLAAIVDGIRSRVAGAVEPEEFEAMTSALQKIAREFGWEEGARLPRPRRHGARHRRGRDDHRHGGRHSHRAQHACHGEHGEHPRRRDEFDGFAPGFGPRGFRGHRGHGAPHEHHDDPRRGVGGRPFQGPRHIHLHFNG
ncbi:hypothetical protein GCM10025768_03530 [Microbacterium pseudoresistens]|uniref:MarR family transcriptional regulator n=1 Tax=Microbacterium pseudoresistens TaxID=640634 RepID=A0A7Y9JNZ8_9MICO|nr:hypothetical protein [Microbacterium pseudoresistens]NYD54189.1 hypothetical protein [Microbacterium pseudoresistens]